jgi:hypothetical protein
MVRTRRHRKETGIIDKFLNIQWERLILITIGAYLAYEIASKIHHCRSEEDIYIETTRQVLEGPACIELKNLHHGYINCDEIAKQLTPTYADVRWWSCIFGSIGFLQSKVSWFGIVVGCYLLSIWLNRPATAPAPVASQQPPVVFFQTPHTGHFAPSNTAMIESKRRNRREGRSYSEEQSDSESDSSSCEIIG